MSTFSNHVCCVSLFSRYLQSGTSELSTVEEFSISSVRLFHLLKALTQNEFILNDFKAFFFFSSFLL